MPPLLLLAFGVLIIYFSRTKIDRLPSLQGKAILFAHVLFPTTTGSISSHIARIEKLALMMKIPLPGFLPNV